MSADEKLKDMLMGLAASYDAELDVQRGIERLRADNYGFEESQFPQDRAGTAEAPAGQRSVSDDQRAAGQASRLRHGHGELTVETSHGQGKTQRGGLAATQTEERLLYEELSLLRLRAEAELDRRRADAELEVSRAKFEAEKTRQLAELKAQQIELDARQESAAVRNHELRRNARSRSSRTSLSWLVASPAAVLALITTVGSVFAFSRTGLSLAGLLFAGASVFMVAAYATAILWAVLRMTSRRPPRGAEMALRLLLGSLAHEEALERAPAWGSDATISNINPEQPTAEPMSSSHARPRGPTFSGENCTVVLTDVQAFNAHRRNDQDRRVIRQSLLSMTRAALGSVWDECACEDRGDGLLIIVPPKIPTANVMEHLYGQLPAALAQHNRTYGPALRIQLRLAVTVGPVFSDRNGLAGQSILDVARLVEAPILKQAIADSNTDLGVIASMFVYDTVIRPGEVPLDPAGYQHVEVNVKESRLSAWLQLVDAPEQVRRSGAQAAVGLPAGSRTPSHD